MDRVYNDEFLPQLISQATDVKGRYSPVQHEPLSIGDIVLLKEENMKQTNYPMGRVKSVTVNDMGEVTGAIVYKGRTGESVKRHASALIPLLRDHTVQVDTGNAVTDTTVEVPRRTRRAAAIHSERRSREMLDA